MFLFEYPQSNAIALVSIALIVKNLTCASGTVVHTGFFSVSGTSFRNLVVTTSTSFDQIAIHRTFEHGLMEGECSLNSSTK